MEPTTVNGTIPEVELDKAAAKRMWEEEGMSAKAIGEALGIEMQQIQTWKRNNNWKSHNAKHNVAKKGPVMVRCSKCGQLYEIPDVSQDIQTHIDCKGKIRYG